MSSTLTVCKKCHALNNVDSQKALAKQATCGKCKAPLELHSLVTSVNSDDLKRIVAKSDKPVIVDFWAEWCGPCKMYGPEFQKASEENQNAVFLKVDTEMNQDLSSELGIRGIPTTIVFKNGKEVKRQSGALPRSMISQMVNGS